MANHSFQHLQTADHSYDPTPSQIPEQIGPYLVECLIQQTPLLDSYRGFDPSKRVPVFIKQLSQHAIDSSPLARAHFSTEVRLLRMIKHPNITHLLQAGMQSGLPYLVCSYVPGVTLRDFLIYELPRPSEAYHILAQIASALSYLHSRQIIHNDLKPENIRISPSLHVTLVDFSIAQNMERKEDLKIQQLAGTLLYMSPEQQTQKELSAASDLYSFAIIAYELICGRLSHGIIQLQQLPLPLQPIFSKALQEDPKQRFKSITEFFTALDQTRSCVAGLHLPMRNALENQVLIDFKEPRKGSSKTSLMPLLDGELIFVRGSSFQGEKSLLAIRKLASSSFIVFADTPQENAGWLYYLKSDLDHLPDSEWKLEKIKERIEATCHLFKLDSSFSSAILELAPSPHLPEQKQLDLLLHGQMMGCFVESDQKTQYGDGKAQWNRLSYSPSEEALVFFFNKHQASAPLMAGLIDGVCELCHGDLVASCNLISRRLGDTLNQWHLLQSPLNIDIKTLAGAIPVLGIHFSSQRMEAGSSQEKPKQS